MGDIMAKATKLPSGNWNVRALEYTDENGKKHFKSFTAPTKKEAEYLAADYYANKKAKAAAGIANITLSEAIRRYIDSMNNILSSYLHQTKKTARVAVFFVFGLTMHVSGLSLLIAKFHF